VAVVEEIEPEEVIDLENCKYDVLEREMIQLCLASAIKYY
jgi:hypothetical protein